MSFISLHFAALVCTLFFFYYALPKRFQPFLLLAGSLYFYYRCSGFLLFVMAGASLLAFLFGRLQSHKKKQGFLVAVFVILLSIPLFLFRYSTFFLTILHLQETALPWNSIGIPIGISFYTLQLISYCVDVYHEKYEPEKNFIHFLLFTCFFPQILQGPIPRYNELKQTLFTPHEMEEDTIWNGVWKILSGLFLKLVIADKAGVFVNTIFHAPQDYNGAFHFTAGCLYSIQLYTDFLSCVLLAQGVALLFGIRLSENFARPYLATSVKDFWRRWHISLSSWLRDYIYIPLGGSRKGTIRTNLNLLVTFFISGLWHGGGFTFLVWGLQHGFYQLIGKYTVALRNRFFKLLHCPASVRIFLQRLTTFFFVMLAWIMFRASSVKDGIYAWKSIFLNFHIRSFMDGSMLECGLLLPEFIVLLLFIVLLFFAEVKAEHKQYFGNIWLRKGFFFKFCCSLLVLLIIILFGTYGVGYDEGAFIYGGF